MSDFNGYVEFLSSALENFIFDAHNLGFSMYRLSFMKKLLPKYFDGEWSYAQFRIQDSKALCAFSDDGNTLIVVSTDGQYYLADIPRKKGDCIKKEQKSLI